MGSEAIFSNIPESWEVTTLGEVCARGKGVIQTGPFGSQLHASDYVPVGIPTIMPKNIGDNRVVEDGISRITEKDAQRLDKYRVRFGDIVYSRRGDVRRRALIRHEQNGWLCGTGSLMVRFGDAPVNSVYASYFLGHPRIQDWVEQHAVGATMPNLNTSIMASVPFVIPPLPKQNAIAEILGSLDDKIELNRQMNQTLEFLARAIFKSWFVDFDPVRVKAEGYQPVGMDTETAILFPNEFEESALGEIPRGWKIENVGNVVKAVGGGTPSTKEPLYWEDGKHFFATPKDLSNLSAPILLETERKVTDAGLSKISSGLLPAGVMLLSSRAPVGYLAITKVPVCVNQGFIAMICDGPVSNFYMLLWANASMDQIKGRASGTTFAEISKTNFRPIQIVIPSIEVMDAFNKIIEPVFEKIAANLEESQILATLRDALLPRLMSGEVRVNDVKSKM